MNSSSNSDPKPEQNQKPSRQSPPDKFDRGSDRGHDDDVRPPYPIPWLLILGFASIMVYFLMRDSPASHGTRVRYDFFNTQVTKQNVESVKIYDEVIAGEWKAPPKNPDKPKETLPKEFNVIVRSENLDREYIEELSQKVPKVEQMRTRANLAEQLFFWLIISLLFFAFIWYIMRRNAETVGGGDARVLHAQSRQEVSGRSQTNHV